MTFQSREEYEARKRRTATPEPGAPAPAAPALAASAHSAGTSDDVTLRLSPLYGGLVLGAGVIFTAIGFLRFGKAGPTFHTICVLAGLAAILGGILLLRSRPVIVRLTPSALELQGASIPWSAIRDVERVRSGRNYWIGVYLRTPRTDLDSAALKARAALEAMRSRGADFDYVVLETDLPRSGLWFVDECRRRVAAAAASPDP
ncbi:MAG TPA: hypothetical protein VGO79_03700 [Thermoanaerobaculia bacterium]